MEGVPLIIEPDPEDPDCASVLVEGTIAGRPFRFLLDTGAARTTLVADEAIAALDSRARHQSPGVLGARSNSLVTVRDLVVGPMTIPALEAERTEATQNGARSLLGMDVLGRRCCHFRFDTGMLVLQRSPAGQAGLALQAGDRGHAYVEVHWPGVTARACFDTGAGITIVDQAFLLAHPGLFAAAGTSTGTDSAGAQAQTATFMMTGAHIGGALFAPHKVASVDLSQVGRNPAEATDLILGYPTLRQANWLLDFPARRWGLTRQPDSGPA